MEKDDCNRNGVAFYLDRFYREQLGLEGDEKINMEDLFKTIRGQVLFRGQANEDWAIQSSAGRRLKNQMKQTGSDINQTNFVNQKRFISYHVNLVADARSYGYGQIKSGSTLSDLELLAEIQHLGGSTCLVDFSTNFLIALWMATDMKEDANGKLFWIDMGLDTNQQNILYYNRYKEGDTIQRLLTKVKWSFESKDRKIEPCFWLWKPSMLNNRILMQDSVFMFGLAAFPKDGQDKNARINYKSIIINKNDKMHIREELDKFFAISTETVYYDLEGYALEANNFSIVVMR